MKGKPSIIQLSEAKTLKAGKARGPAFGGNLSVFQSIIGTPYCPDFTGSILFFEDIGDELSRYDRMLGHLRQVGAFEQCAGVVFGNMSEAKDTGRKPFGFSCEEVIAEHCTPVKGPVIINAPFGHVGPFYSLPVGRTVTLTESSIQIDP